MVDVRIARKGIEMLYLGLCDIQEQKQIKHPATGIISGSWTTVVLNEPCRLSFKAVGSAGDGVVATTAQTIKLFLRPELDVMPGSRIKVVQNGRTGFYKQSGIPAVYTNHQEILLEIEQKWV